MILKFRDDQLYPLYTEDVDGESYLTTWSGEGKWFYAVRKGYNITRPYWDAPMKDHVTLAIFDNKQEAKEYMLSHLEPNIYLSCGWIINVNENKKEK